MGTKMRVFAVSDIHYDYDSNRRWVEGLSKWECQDDTLILAGDISHREGQLKHCLEQLCGRFRKVLFIPGNHDLWVTEDEFEDSLQKLDQVEKWVREEGATTAPFTLGDLSIVPLYSWYDFTFGQPASQLRDAWMDFRLCRWPQEMNAESINEVLLGKNQERLALRNRQVISFSHFLPRIDVMPSYIPAKYRVIYPVLGSSLLDYQIRQIGSCIHVYGHSHVNTQVSIDGVEYINNAYGTPAESRHTRKKLICIYEC